MPRPSSVVANENTDSAYYTQAEAQRLIGRVFENQIEFARVPKGTRGTVVEIDRMGDGWDVVVEWDLPIRMPSGQGLRDWFTREEMDRFMRQAQG